MRDHIDILYRELLTARPQYLPAEGTRQYPKLPDQDTTAAPRLKESETHSHALTVQTTYSDEAPEAADSQIELRAQKKLRDFGVVHLSNTELVSLLLGNGQKDHPVQQLAAKVFNQLAREPFATTQKSLESIVGMEQDQSAAILAAMELGRRLLRPSPKKMSTPEAIFRNVVHFADQQENLVALNLNGACEMISIRLITRGTINRNLIHPREIFAHAVREQAHSVIIAHNHPSGHLEPSKEDLLSTRRLQKASDILGIRLLDHIIFCADRYLSLVETGYFSI